MIAIAIAFITLGVMVLAVAALGSIRLPDFYTRSHALGVMDTLGSLFVLSGLCVYHGLSFISAKLLFILLFIYVANPTVTHILVRAGLRCGLKPWRKGGSKR